MYRKLFSFLGLFIFILTGCELHEPMEAIPAPAAKEGGECPTEYRRFDLEFTCLVGGDCFVTIETGPFIVEGCMCRVVQYELYVTKTSSNQWELTLSPNLPVPYVPSALASQDLLTITDIGPIFENIGDLGNGILKAIIATHSPVEQPQLNHAGGLCIIENYDGNGTGGFPVGSPANGPIVVLAPGSVPDSYTVKVYIPSGVTDPV